MGASVLPDIPASELEAWRAWDEFHARRAWRERVAAEERFRQAKASHPLAAVVDGLDEGAVRASCRPMWRLKARDYGNGLREACVWLHRPDISGDLERAVERDLAALAVPRGEGDREANSERATRRARQKVRETCKALGVNALWTLTYRANVTDREVCLRHLDRFRRKVEAVLPGWRYVAVLERQERGAWHVHLATHALPSYFARGGVRLKSWDVMRGIWRAVTGELGGNFDESKRRRRWGLGEKPVRGAGAIASYIAGYVAKEMQASELNRKRYSRTTGVVIPGAERSQWDHEAVRLAELIELAYAAVGDRITRAFFDPLSRVFFIESDDSAGVG